jgi:tetratricopeptide (TPR) repeat protein
LKRSTKGFSMSEKLWPLFLVLAILGGGRAQADEDPVVTKARIHLRAGISDYDEGRYAEAAVQMERAYALAPLPELKYNLAQCYERLDRLDDAAQAYDAYLAGSKEVPDRVAVQKRIANLRERARAEAEGRRNLPVKIEEKVVWKTVVVYREVPPPPGRAARGAAYGLVVLGAGGIAAGIAFAVLTTQASNQVQGGGSVANPPAFDGELRARQDAARLYPIGTGLGFGVGALAVGGAIGLILVSKKIDREVAHQRELARLPRVAPYYLSQAGVTTAGLLVDGRF